MQKPCHDTMNDHPSDTMNYHRSDTMNDHTHPNSEIVLKKHKGRPKAFIDWQEASEFFEAHATAEEVAAYFGIDNDTLNDRCRSDNHTSITNFSARCRRNGRLRVRLAQYRQALGGHFLSLIWLGKQWLDQRENPLSTKEPDGKLIYMINMINLHAQNELQKNSCDDIKKNNLNDEINISTKADEK